MRQEPRGEREKLRPKEKNKEKPETSQSSLNRDQEGIARAVRRNDPKDALDWTGEGGPGKLGDHLLGDLSAPPAARSPQQVLLPSSR